MERRHPEAEAAAPETAATRSAHRPFQPHSRLASRTCRMDTTARMGTTRALAAGAARMELLDLTRPPADGA